MVRKSPDAPFERVPLVRSETATDGHQYEGMLFDLAGPIDYFVEAAGVRSPTYTLKVVDLPYVQQLELEYHFPAYTGLAAAQDRRRRRHRRAQGHRSPRARHADDDGARAAQIVLNDKDTAPLTPPAATARSTGEFKADKDGFYRIELDAPTGERVTASPQYTSTCWPISRRRCRLPSRAATPSASPIEEVFVEARAEDDFGVKDLELVYSVNGGAEKTLRLFDGKKRLAEVTAGHTFYLEELDVQAGRLRVLLRARGRQRRRGRRQAHDERHLLPADPSAAQGLQARRVARRRRRWRRRQPDRSARCRSSSARSSPRRSTSSATARR